MSGSRSQKLIGIQFGRAVAAILVVFYHGGRMLPQYLGNITFARFFEFGNAGVDFFFVLSGFIIFYVHFSDIDQPSRLSRYIFRRVTRIYPIYWVVASLGIAVFAAKRDWVDLAPLHVLASIFLLPEAQTPVVGVAWTLTHEVLFYAVFAVLIYSRFAGLTLCGIWAALVCFGAFVPHTGTLIHFVEDPYHIEFALGALAAYLARTRPADQAPLIAAIGIVAFLIIGLQFNGIATANKVAGRLMYGLSSTAIVYGLAVWETRGTVRFPAWAAFLGAASYSIYLVHTFLLGWIGRVLGKFVEAGSAPSSMYVVVVMGAVTGGGVLYQAVEKPLQSFIRQKQSAWITHEQVSEISTPL